MTYTNPTAPGALLKAALVCAGVVRKESSKNFSQQLLEVNFYITLMAIFIIVYNVMFANIDSRRRIGAARLVFITARIGIRHQQHIGIRSLGSHLHLHGGRFQSLSTYSRCMSHYCLLNSKIVFKLIR